MIFPTPAPRFPAPRTPASAFIPLLILWAGLGELQKLLVIFIGSFFQLVLMIAVIVGATRGRRFPAIARTTGDRIGVFAAGEGEWAERILRERGAEEVRRVAG